MDSGPNFREGLSLSGIFKILEVAIVFSAIMVHRYGANGSYLFFGTSTDQMSAGDEGMDVENIGNAALVTFSVISSVLWIGYVMDSRFIIQRFFLEPFWNFLATCMFMGVGVKTLIVWAKAKSEDTQITSDSYYATYGAGLALGSLCVIASIVYSIDFCISVSARNKLRADDYYY
ncbi:hypothetical protein TCAL_02928 [Tigriopus californicus]|uniref:MARVEL domain-containing protein n=1 Tax=Tigriopus californicus TaxID=6832 RepID=A0A553NQS5_TIGCA|nr:uncharacterized protein LOC131879473 isoform X2 [Tigriopus californicus]TRY67787.1 hypothetical protein TCAL_02928 [Tigriopus californicus]|eukprot:TCALIF_02928-PA protein Name:"Protein of unknown function" AED:0.00 eAED:0.00 QI:75/1/1/1/1/1/3/32/174